jgi:hypothetical protein
MRIIVICLRIIYNCVMYGVYVCLHKIKCIVFVCIVHTRVAYINIYTKLGKSIFRRGICFTTRKTARRSSEGWRRGKAAECIDVFGGCLPYNMYNMCIVYTFSFCADRRIGRSSDTENSTL